MALSGLRVAMRVCLLLAMATGCDEEPSVGEADAAPTTFEPPEPPAGGSADAAPHDAGGDSEAGAGDTGTALDPAPPAPPPSGACDVPVPSARFELPRQGVEGALADDDAGVPVDLTLASLTAGPVVGATSDRAAKIWVRVDRAARLAVAVWPQADASHSSITGAADIDASTDFVGLVEIAPLAAATRYAYQLLTAPVGAPDDDLVPLGPVGSFATLPTAGVPSRIRFALGADVGSAADQPIFEQIADVQPDFMLFIGDQVYADNTTPDIASYLKKYRTSWTILQRRELMRNLPTLAIWDDHEIADNFYPGMSERYEPARFAYELYVQAANPAPVREGGLYYTFEAGDVGFFVLDTRSHRSPNKEPDGPDKSMLGLRQKADLLRWLECTHHALKVVVSSVIFAPWATTGSDSWRGFAAERAELYDFIADRRIDDVLLIGGDQHWSAVFLTTHAAYRFYEFLPTPLSKAHRDAPTAATEGILARDDDNDVFGVVDIDTTVTPATLALTLCAAGKPCDPGNEAPPGTSLDVEGDDENVPFTLRLTADDLGL